MDKRERVRPKRPSGRKLPALRAAMQVQAREAYRDAILDAAERVLASGRFGEAKVAEIAEQAGVSVGTLYNYFSSKEHVLASLFERGRSQLFSLLEPEPDAASPIERIRRMFERTFGFIEEHGSAFITYLRVVSRDAPEYCQLARVGSSEDRARFLNLIEELLRRGVEDGLVRSDIEPGSLAVGLFSLMNGQVHVWIHRPEAGLTCHISTLLKLFFEGAGAK
ncbi:MAG: TetR/AcrR family transcriptional regulator [Polyangiaceae bacterium]|nr:TetR/AcrR family transcriptional regulator [Polyangiaceae bacterium]